LERERSEYDSITLAVRLRLEESDKGTYHLQVAVLDQDNKRIGATPKKAFSVEGAEFPSMASVLIDLSAKHFAESGTFRLGLLVDRKLLAVQFLDAELS
jgi:hypothetical protein